MLQTFYFYEIAILLNDETTILYKITPATEFINTVGKTTVVNKIEKLTGNPTSNNADNKKVVPLINVPKANINTKMIPLNFSFLNLLINILFKQTVTTYIILAVTILSIIFGTCPKGNLVVSAVNIPVIASGGAGKIDDFSEVFEKTGATAALAASLFHFKELTVQQVKEHCRNKGIIVR